MSFRYVIETSKEFEKIISDLTETLKGIGFGVLGILDFKEIFEKKGVEFGKNYKLLEVCNPMAAKNVLDVDPDFGLLLPCTIAVYEKDNQNIVSLAKPTSILSIVQNDSLQQLSKKIKGNLISVIEKSK